MTPSRQETRTCAAAALSRWAITVLESSGVPQDSARLAAGILVRTSLRGIDTHGLSRLPAYVDKLVSGEVNAKARPRLETVHGLLRCDGDQGLGQIVAATAMEHAMGMARTQAVVACSIASSGHLAALGTFALTAAEQGLVAVLCQQTPPIMSLPGAQGRAIGNNPLAFAMPVAGRPPLVFDMAHSVVARGHLMQAVREGQDTVPADWALGPDGQPTTDPLRALAGAMQPIAGHKGVGLAMLVECLAGSFSGGQAPKPATSQSQGGSTSGVSAFLLVLNPALSVGQERFEASVDAWLARYLEVSGHDARYPGQRQAACEQQRSQDGIPLPAGLIDELRQVGKRIGHPFMLADL